VVYPRRQQIHGPATPDRHVELGVSAMAPASRQLAQLHGSESLTVPLSNNVSRIELLKQKSCYVFSSACLIIESVISYYLHSGRAGESLQADRKSGRLGIQMFLLAEPAS